MTSHFSITHHHLAGVISTEVAKRRPQDGTKPLRILDVGCGRGTLLDHLQQTLPTLIPGVDLELHGFDVSDSKVQKEDFFSGTLERLNASHPAIDWPSRLVMINSEDAWPYPDDHFDFVVSNQVLEHVRDHQRTFESIARVMKPEGVSAHLFPLKDCWNEWHLKIPFAHWFTNADLCEAWIKACSLWGFGKWRDYNANLEKISSSEYARINRDFIALETNYVTEDDIVRFTKLAGLKYSFRYTDDFYFNRLRMARREPLTYAFPDRSQMAARLRFMAWRRTSSICLVLEKGNAYVNRGFHTAGG